MYALASDASETDLHFIHIFVVGVCSHRLLLHPDHDHEAGSVEDTWHHTRAVHSHAQQQLTFRIYLHQSVIEECEEIFVRIRRLQVQ